MRKMKKIILASILSFQVAFGAYQTGNDLLPICESGIRYLNDSAAYYSVADEQNFLICSAYFEGASDQYFDTLLVVNPKAYQSLSNQLGTITTGQSVRMFTQYLSNHPNRLQYSGASLILFYYGDTYNIPAK